MTMVIDFSGELHLPQRPLPIPASAARAGAGKGRFANFFKANECNAISNQSELYSYIKK